VGQGAEFYGICYRLYDIGLWSIAYERTCGICLINYQFLLYQSFRYTSQSDLNI